MARAQAKRVYHPGDEIPESAIYRATHYQHRLPHLVTIKAEAVHFPECQRCHHRVTFEVMAGDSLRDVEAPAFEGDTDLHLSAADSSTVPETSANIPRLDAQESGVPDPEES